MLNHQKITLFDLDFQLIVVFFKKIRVRLILIEDFKKKKNRIIKLQWENFLLPLHTFLISLIKIVRI